MHCSKIIFRLCLLAISLVSCSGEIAPVYLDVLQPAKIPTKVNSGIVLINNLARSQASSGRYMDMGRILIIEKMDILGQMAIDSAAKYLQTSDFFSTAQALSTADRNKYPVKDSLTTPLLTRIRVESGCRQVVFVDSLRYNVFYTQEKVSPYLADTTTIRFYRLNAAYRMVLRSYIDGVKDPARSVLVDTISWIDIAKDSLPSLPSVLSVSAHYMAQLMRVEMEPSRIQTERIRYTPYNTYMLKAERLVKKNRWDEASSIWHFVHNNSNSKILQAKAALNIALGYELKDDYSPALSWLEKSKNLFRSDPVSYKEDISMVTQITRMVNKRNDEKMMLDKQFPTNR